MLAASHSLTANRFSPKTKDFEVSVYIIWRTLGEVRGKKAPYMGKKKKQKKPRQRSSQAQER